MYIPFILSDRKVYQTVGVKTEVKIEVKGGGGCIFEKTVTIRELV